MFKNKNRILECKLELDFIDGFVYFFLVAFLIFCISIDLNIFKVIIFAIVFVLGIFGVYVCRYKLKNKSFYKAFPERIDTLTEEDLKKIIWQYYKEMNYEVIKDNNDLYVKKNNNKYKLYFIIGEITSKKLKMINKEKFNIKDVKGKILITNKEFSKENLNYIRQNKLYSISRPGIIDIIIRQDKLKNKSKSKPK